MKQKHNMDQVRSQYLGLTKDLVTIAMQRQSRLSGDLCPACQRTDEETREALKAVAELNRRAASICDRMRSIEKRVRGAIGIPTVFTQDVPNVIRITVAILAGKSLCGSLIHETRSVASLCETAGGNDPDDMVTLREAFTRHGVLRPYVHCSVGRTIDELADVTLSENAFRSYLALESDTEMADIMAARAMAGRR